MIELLENYHKKLKLTNKKSKKFLISSLYVTLIIINSSFLDGRRDSSMRDPSITTSFNIEANMRIVLMSFAYGEVFERNQNYLVFSAINRGIDCIYSYRKRHIDRQFYEKHRRILDQPRGCGYWLWKPYLILETLNRMSENDILIYVDASICINTSIEKIISKLQNDNISLLLLENYHTNQLYIKRDTYDIMEVDYIYRKSQHLDAAFLVMKKTPQVCNFIEKWLYYCCIEQAITDIPSIAPEFPDFSEHRHDQAILSLLYRKYPDPMIELLPPFTDIRDIFFNHRRRIANIPIIDHITANLS